MKLKSLNKSQLIQYIQKAILIWLFALLNTSVKFPDQESLPVAGRNNLANILVKITREALITTVRAFLKNLPLYHYQKIWQGVYPYQL